MAAPVGWSRVRRSLLEPVDIGFLVLFRVVMGAAVLWDLVEYAREDLATTLATRPFRFTYYGFEWVQPWSVHGLRIHFAVLGFFALLLVCGCLYRLSAAVVFVGFTYVFLLEKAFYLNHDYLTCLLLVLLVLLPANRAASVDAWLRPSLRRRTVPAWMLWLVRFQVGLPYVYGGIAKLNGDWLRGQPMGLWLPKSPWRHLVGPIAEEHWVALFFSWGGLLFDLAIVPLLLWRRTRPFAFLVAIAFHLMNAFMFNIGVFPWMMIAATLVFFQPDCARRIVPWAFAPDPLPPSEPAESEPAPTGPRFLFPLLGVYVAFHLLWPLRHHLYPGNVNWTEEGHRFAWRMMLRTKETGMRFDLVDVEDGTRESVDVTNWLDEWQFNKMSRDPEMMREFANFLARRHEETTGRAAQVHVATLCSLNGRPPQPLIDPNVDLGHVDRTIWHKPWILPLTNPLPPPEPR